MNIIIKLIRYPQRLLIKLNFFNKKHLKERFSIIHESNYWDCSETVSGPGSTMKNTLNLRRKLKIIKKNKNKFNYKNTSFYKKDITTQSLPRADLFICRDFMFHLSFKDTYNFLKNLKKSKSKYLLISSHFKDKNKKNINKDVISGDFRKIDIFQPPFNFKKSYEMVIKDYCDGTKKYLYLFKREDFIKFSNSMKF